MIFNTSFLKKLDFDRFDYVMLCILLVGIFLRLWHLETHLIFFGDIGRDFLVAHDMVTQGKVPLLGIPSSIPRFHQGPLMIWFIAFGLFLSNGNAVFVGYLTAFLGILTIVYLYVFVRSYITPTAAVFSTAILATSPLAVAHSRMPYHTAPLPLMTVFFLHMLLRFDKQHKWSGFFVGLAWAAVFQFELAMFPLAFMIPLVWAYQHKEVRSFPFLKVVGGVLIGLTPQILYDLTHSFSHMGGFLIWVVYRLVAFGGYGGEHTVSLQKFGHTIELLSEYFSRILVYNNVALTWLILILTFIILIYTTKTAFSQITGLEIFATTSVFILLIAFFIHSSPSEAYFPPFCVLFAIVIGGALSKIVELRVIIISLLTVFVGYSAWSIYSSNFFISPTNSYISYGPGYGEQQLVIQHIHTIVADKSVTFSSTDPDAHFEAYLAGYRYISLYLGKPVVENQPDYIFFIDQKSQELKDIPGAMIYEFPSVDVGVIQ